VTEEERLNLEGCEEKVALGCQWLMCVVAMKLSQAFKRELGDG